MTTHQDTMELAPSFLLNLSQTLGFTFLHVLPLRSERGKIKSIQQGKYFFANWKKILFSLFSVFLIHVLPLLL